MALSTFRAKIQRNMKKLGIDALTPFQSNSISSILNKQNTLILSEPGSGKSLSYTIALSQSISLTPVSLSETHTKLFEKPLPLPKSSIRGALILVPTQELSLQIYKYFRLIAPWLNVSRTNCGIGEVCARIGEVKKNVESIEKNEAKGLGNVALGIEWGCIDVLISTPGLLNDIINYRIVNGLSMINPKSIVVDEADMMLEENDLVNLIKKVFKNIEDCGKRQFILAGALMPNSAYSPSPFPILAKSFSGLKMVASDCFKKIPTDLKFNLVKISKNPDSLTAEKLIALIKPSNQKFVIFANFISRCHDIYSELVKNRITASVITSDMYIEERIEDFFDFFQDTQVLISMNIVSRGLEFNADHIVLYNLPSTLTSFVNKIGRVGRRGRPGEVTLLLNEDEIGIMEHLKPGNDWEEVYKYYAARCKKKSKFQSVLDIEVEESENE